MIVEIVRIVADWLDAGTDASLATLVPLVPRDGADPLPAVPTVVECTTDAEAALMQAPSAGLPVLQVLAQDAALTERGPTSAPVPADADAELLLRLCYASTDAAAVVRDAGYVMRAIRRSLRLLQTTAAGQTARTRGQVQVLTVADARGAPVFTPVDDQVVTGGLLVTVTARDLWAAGV